MSIISLNSLQTTESETKEILRAFVSESFNYLENNEKLIENLLMPDNSEFAFEIYKVFHTLKGLSGFFNLSVINKIANEAEILLDVIRSENEIQSDSVITTIYQTFDFIKNLLSKVSTEFTDSGALLEAEDMALIIQDAANTLKNIEDEIVPDFLADFPNPYQNVSGTDNPADYVEQFTDELPDENPDEENILADFGDEYDKLISDDMLDTYLTNSNDLLDISERDLLELEKNPNQDDLIGETFGSIHSLKGNSGFMGFSEVEEITIEMETILDSIRSKKLEITQNVITVLLSNIETIRMRLDLLSQRTNQKRVQSDSISSSHAPIQESPTSMADANEFDDSSEKEQKESTKKDNKKIDLLKSTNMHLMPRKDLRVETLKIDKLFDLVGELITIETMVTQSPDLIGLDLPNFSKSANMLNKITRELQEISMSIRMMPLDGLFNKMKRLVRDVSLKMNKKVELRISGQDTEMDKNVIDEIADPLVHILRNAIDHGIESPEERLAKGKPEEGVIYLSARYEGNEILITIEDDGAGINKSILLKKAEEKGLLKDEPENMKDKDIYMLIFEPGFSTAKEITEISGRGVGMDVVKKNIEKLRGSVDINSKENVGSRFTLRIPLTLAILDAMVIRLGNAQFALPILSLRESFRPNKENINITMDGLEVIRVRDEVLPIVRLHEIFKIQPSYHNLADGILMIIEARNRKICLFADDIIGQQQAVVKGLSDYIGKVDGIMGCMIIGDGSIGLILDIESLIDLAQIKKN